MLEAIVAFVFADPRITESSGLATSSTGELVYTHNDSGDEGRFFAVGPDGRTRTAYVVPGVEPRDWEDMARGPDEQGRSSLWLGDIGDNNAVRINRLPEPGKSIRRAGEDVALGAVVLAIGIVASLANAAISAGSGNRAGPDPWRGDTLEWLATSPPPPHNFDVVPDVRSDEPMRDVRDAVERRQAPDRTARAASGEPVA